MDDDVSAVSGTSEQLVDEGPQYPIEWEADVVLRDGSTSHVRPIRPDDADALQRFHMGQSEQSTYLRFFAYMERLSDRDLERFTRVDYTDRVALVAVRARADAQSEDDQDIIGVARYDRTFAHEAEVAFNISDSEQGRGLGSVLLEHLAAAARERGVQRFTAEVLPQNGKMLAVFREAGYELSQHVEDGVVSVSFDLDPTQRSRAVMADREHRAEARSMQGLFAARSVVVVGPDAEDGPSLEHDIAARAAAALAHLSPDVEVVVVGSGDGAADGVLVVRSLAEVTGPIDLAVLALPPADSADAVLGLARLGVRGVVVLTQGYGDQGADGLARQRDLVRAAHAGGMRVVGPASYGLFTTGTDSPLAATLARELPVAGTVGVFCQSAPTAVMLLATVGHRGLGVSSFLSSGHRADVSGNDVMQFWQEDPATSVACLYLESIGNPRKFSRIARRLAAVKPVVVVIAGRTGHVVPPGHAVRRTRAPRRTLDEMLRQSGVIRAENTHQMVDIAQLLAHQPLPAGRRLGILASSAAFAALVAEAATSAGLQVSATQYLPEGADAATLDAAVEAIYADGVCDAVAAVYVPVVGDRDPQVSRRIAQAAARTGRPTVATFLELHGLTDELTATDTDGNRCRVPAYATAQSAIAALGAVVRYAMWREADHGGPLDPAGIDAARARAIVDELVKSRSGEVPISGETLAELLGCYGIQLWPSRVISTADEAVAAAVDLGWPVALKSTAPALRHRSDLGAVRLDIGTEADLRAAVAAMRSTLTGVLPDTSQAPLEVQAMATAGVACAVQSSEDPLFGPVVSFGLAGDAVDLLGDISSRIPPLTTDDVSQMIRSVRAAPRLFGYLGSPKADTAALEDLLGRVAVMADDLPELRVLELYPVVVAERGVAVLSANATIEDVQRADAMRRALPE